MKSRQPEYSSSTERANPEQPRNPEGIRVFEAVAWVPVWEQSDPGRRIVLGTVPTSCNLYLEPEPYFAIEVNLEEKVGNYIPIYKS